MTYFFLQSALAAISAMKLLQITYSIGVSYDFKNSYKFKASSKPQKKARRPHLQHAPSENQTARGRSTKTSLGDSESIKGSGVIVTSINPKTSVFFNQMGLSFRWGKLVTLWDNDNMHEAK